MRPAIAIQRPTRVAYLLALCLFAALLSPAHAAPETGDVYAAGGDVRTGGPIRGDFGAAGGKVSLDEPVAGDAWLAGGSVDVRAPVRDRLRVAGGEVNVDSVVGGQLVAAGGQVALGSDAVIGGNARLYGGRINVEGRVDGDLHASARRLTINGEVRGDVDARADTIELGPDARIAGTLRYSSRSELRKADGASIAGAVVRNRGRSLGGDDVVIAKGEWNFPRPWRLGSIAAVLSLLACAAVFLLLVPRYGVQAAQRLAEGPLGALTLGVVAVIAVPVIAVLLCITILGIPLGLLLFAVYPVLLLAGFIIAVLAIARALAAALRRPAATGFAATFGWFTLALVLVLLAGLVPGVGKVAIALMVLGGTGAALVELQRRRKGGGPTPTDRPVSARAA
jgi:cytoskeletal protein CcmA (bactofilin family)